MTHDEASAAAAMGHIPHLQTLVNQLLQKRGLQPTIRDQHQRDDLVRRMSAAKSRLHASRLCNLLADDVDRLAMQQAQWEATAHQAATDTMLEARAAANAIARETLREAVRRAQDIERAAAQSAEQAVIAARLEARRILESAAEVPPAASPTRRPLVNSRRSLSPWQSGRNERSGMRSGADGHAPLSSVPKVRGPLSRENFDYARSELWPQFVQRLTPTVGEDIAVHLTATVFTTAEQNLPVFENFDGSLTDWLIMIADREYESMEVTGATRTHRCDGAPSRKSPPTETTYAEAEKRHGSDDAAT